MFCCGPTGSGGNGADGGIFPCTNEAPSRDSGTCPVSHPAPALATYPALGPGPGPGPGPCAHPLTLSPPTLGVAATAPSVPPTAGHADALSAAGAPASPPTSFHLVTTAFPWPQAPCADGPGGPDAARARGTPSSAPPPTPSSPRPRPCRPLRRPMARSRNPSPYAEPRQSKPSYARLRHATPRYATPR